MVFKNLKQFFMTKKFYVITFFTLILLIPPIMHAFIPKVKYNQFLIQELEITYRTTSIALLWDTVRSTYSSGLNALLGRGISKEPDFDDAPEVFSFIYSWIPQYAVVYPTEGFYYFKTELQGKKISGNVRVADLDKGRISSAYFTIDQPEKKTVFFGVTEQDGLKIKKIHDELYYVTFNGKTIRFKIPKTAHIKPHKLKMLKSEEFIGQIHDESGLKFFLFFNHDTESFYDVLNEEDGVTDTLKELDEKPYMIGVRSGFVFYYDTEYDRKVLVGVHKDNVDINNYLDGPQDQVPFRAKVRALTHIAYPNTLLADGIDEFGVYLNREAWVRNAITPFYNYASLADLYACTKKWHTEKTKSMLWTGLTKEWWNTPMFLRKTIEPKLKEEGKVMPESKWLLMMEERERAKEQGEVNPANK